MKFTPQSDADRRNLTPITHKNGLFINTNLTQKYVISRHVISVPYLHSFIECVLSTQGMESENIISTGNHDTIFGLLYSTTWSCT